MARWPPSARNGGRLHHGTAAGFTSENLAGLNRNPQSLNEEERKLLQDAATEARDFQRETSRKQSEEALAELKEEGMEVTELPPQEMEKLREKAKPVTEKYKQEANPELVKLLEAELAKAREKS